MLRTVPSYLSVCQSVSSEKLRLSIKNSGAHCFSSLMEVTSEGCGFSNTMLWIHGQRRNSYERLEDPGGGKDEEEGEKNSQFLL